MSSPTPSHPPPPTPYPCLTPLPTFLSHPHDYLIIGGGTAGLVLAARLSEDARVKVGVLEAGEAKLDDPSILMPAAFGKLIGNRGYDWGFETVAQAGTHNLKHAFNRGKCLGGSSAINLLMYIRGQAAEYDDWAKLTGYDEWNWEGLRPYFLKHEGFTAPPEDEGNKIPPKYEKENHGTDGPIKTSFPTWAAPITEDWHEASRNAGLQWSAPLDAWSGSHLGGFSNLSTIDRSKGSGTRSYAVTGYLKPNAHRPNLMVLTEALVERVLFERDETSSEVVAKGVVFRKDGELFTVMTSREVILSAGTVQTPQILELSGIGKRSVLESAGIECVVENEAVGEHLEDHMMTGLTYDLVDGEFSLDSMAVPSVAKEAMAKYVSGEGGPFANALTSTGFSSMQDIATKHEAGQFRHASSEHSEATESGLSEAEARVLLTRLQNPRAASLQYFILPASLDPSRLDGGKPETVPGVVNRRITLLVALTHPFSRGTIHIDPKNPHAQPLIDPHYLERSTDVEILSAGVRIADEVFHTSPLKEKIRSRVFPPDKTDLTISRDREEYVRRHTRTEYHPIGTAGMGRVVDEELCIKGVKGLRVVDASVFPLSVSGNIMAAVYAVAEKASDIIKNNYSKKS